MKFELEPFNFGQPDEILLDDLRKVAVSLRKDFVTKEQYNKHGRFSSSTLQNRFGTWCDAHERAGLKIIRNYKATAEDCIEDLKRVANALEKSTVTVGEYNDIGKYSNSLVVRRYGSWAAALQQAGLDISPHFHERIPDEKLFENLEHMWEMLGRQPRMSDFDGSLSQYTYQIYKRHFGAFRKALEAFVASLETKPSESDGSDSDKSDPVEIPYITVNLRHQTSRNVSWRLRFLVMRRDNFKCCFDGRSPALNPGTVLVVDHKVAWEKGGETVIENLQTLCEECNGGKSNLPLFENSEI